MICRLVRITPGREHRESPPMPESLRDATPAPAQGRIGQPRRKGSYGIDAPYLLPVLGVLLIANVVNGVVSGSVWPFVGAAVVLACAACGLYTSRRGKFV